ncbi:hypothetical protein [Occallatibacter riparius]|uniref:Uncharacterized protein n=1 Tax=Occallatibacter riparius TaxID=1002689 RepID=A0A9J7BP58_9BACT|nr:hypothetical protein [Occallatibacter riparius]UWZ84313.1 hypothetical protein MOP44_27675 [Occallatibacter riparius]
MFARSGLAKALTLGFCLLRAVSSVTQEQAKLRQSPTVPNLPDVKREILDLVLQDQWDRCIDMFGTDPQVPSCRIQPAVLEHDAVRHSKARELLAEGKVETGREYFFVALLFQHSGDPNELMLAHVLAVTAASKGFFHAKWMAAATMDRYLLSIGQPQIFGTQSRMENGKWTMEPYARTAISDALRHEWCVIPLADQERVLKAYEQGGADTSTSTADCK